MDTRAFLQKVKPISPYQFAAFRIGLGAYLLVHLANLIPYGAELFSHQGTLPRPQLNFTYGILPNPLEHWDSPPVVTAFLAAMIFLAAAYTAGFYRRTSALLLWYGWACLFNRNNLISNPSIPYVGLLLLLSVLLPHGEPLSLGRRKEPSKWAFPATIYSVAWFLMAAGYTLSGTIKLSSPSWVDGTALVHLLNNPLARPGVFRDIFLASPEWAIRLQTWAVLALEILFLPLSMTRITRSLAWLSMVLMHLSILLVVDFADLSFGMLMVHLFTFDPAWLPPRRGERARLLVLFDGVCGLCDRTVGFLTEEDRLTLLRFAPLQGATAASILQRHPEIEVDSKTIILVRGYNTPNETLALRSEAVLCALDELGGIWRVVSWLRVVPAIVRDAVYDWVARNRYRWFGKYAECRIPTPGSQDQFLP
ncbi:MAG TPA: DCC1-like thiol-disulfide oxidoreductase family protein [Candidatus Methylomirabilis sp.]|jgi:predicted DCC family thiol-disulfide oxidoreductase YuxK|nr:DCC1-like thiol-disulfide oxidoreductase family protein [Candidatus Methylomirabilis sp.]